MLYLVAFPRSGSHWLRTILEYVTGRPSLGCASNIAGDTCLYLRPAFYPILRHVNGAAEPICRKCHPYDLVRTSLNPVNDQVIVVFRNYKECVIRHTMGTDTAFTDIKKQTTMAAMDEYFDVLDWLGVWGGRATVIYYEDLMTHPETVLVPLFKQLGIYTKVMWADFLTKYDELSQVCLAAYDATEGSMTKGRVTNFHASRVDPNFWLDIDARIRSNPNYMRFLGRYLTPRSTSGSGVVTIGGGVGLGEADRGSGDSLTSV